jgi:hypothetical protein
MPKRPVPLWAFVAVIISTTLVNVAVTSYLVRASEKKWCALMVTLDKGYNAPVQGAPPRTARGVAIGAEIHELRVSKLHC